ncbi:MAG TPA: hypothetical protein VNJ04_07225 [Gemmatimonadaceae bacterium]|nr:hypothetical protein [Gemmatimonadaceae bacterium]
MKQFLLVLTLVMGCALPASAQEELNVGRIYLGQDVLAAPIKVLAGNGSPEGAIAAPVGSVYFRADAAITYKKITGIGTTGWYALQDASGKVPALTSAYVASLDLGSLTGTLGTGVQDTITRLGTVTSGVWNAGAITSSGSGIFSGSVVPSASAVWDSGTVSARWANVYGVAGNFSGGLTGTTGTFSGAVTGGTYNGQTISAAASLTGTLAVSGATTVSTLTVTGATALNSTLSVAGNVSLGANLNPATNYTSNAGSLTVKFKELHAAELWVETLVAQSTQATIGGRILVGPTTKLTADLSSTNTQIVVQHNNLALGDRVRLEEAGNLEWLYITSAPSGVGPYTYAVNRNVDASGANIWSAGAAVFNSGTIGKGFIDLYSIGGVLSGVGPAIVGNVRTGPDWNLVEPRWAIGNLNGLYGYAAETYGAAFGIPTGAWIKIDPTNGVRLGHNATTKISLDSAGNASFTGAVTAASGTIGGWVIGATNIVGGGGKAQLDSAGSVVLGTGDDTVILSGEHATYRVWIGKTADPANAPVSITKAGLINLGTGGSLNAGGVKLDASGLYINPVAASGGGAYTNSNAVRWTTDTTYRTAIWRSDDTSVSLLKNWNLEHIVSSDAAEAVTTLLTKAHAVVVSNWSSGTIKTRARSGQTILELWAESDLSGSTSSWRRPFIHFWSGSSAPSETKLVLGVGDISRSTSLSSFVLDYGINISGGITSVTGALTTSSTITERGRSLPLGEWSAVAFAAGNFTASGVGSWTVGSLDQTRYAYSLVGKTMTVVFTINEASVSGAPSTLNLAIPGGFTSDGAALGMCARVVDNGGAATTGLCEVANGGTTIRFYTSATAAGTWATSTDNTYVQGSFTFAVQ